jgi:F0F1-type ATP synthase assembly protein I
VTDPSREPRRQGAGTGLGIGWAVTSTLVAGMLVLGGLGYLLDRIFGTGAGFRAVGIVLGAGLGIYIVYLRYGRGGE